MLSSFFSSAETAVTAINRVKLKSLLDESEKDENPFKHKQAKLLALILEKPKDLITAILIGNNIANVAAASMATTVSLEVMAKFGVMQAAYSLLIVTGLMTGILLVFGEITPKTLAIRHPTRWALKITYVLNSMMILLKPFIGLFNFLSHLISRIFRVDEKDYKRLFTQEDLRSAIKIGEEDGVLEAGETEMIEGVIDFSQKIVREIMTPRTDAICMEIKADPQDIIQCISEKGHSRIPIYDGRIDNIVGIIFAKDLLNIDLTKKDIRPFLHKAVFIPETKEVESLLQQMKKQKFHMAIVVDEYGGMAGLITLEDIIEEIVGEIQDEYDKEQDLIHKVDEHTFMIDASVNIDELEDILDLTFPEDAEYDTLGGFILDELDGLPNKDDQFEYEKFQIKILEVKNNRILKVLFKQQA